MRHWYRRGALAWLLWPASLAFALLVLARRLLFRAGILRSVHPGIPVIVVGNLSVGGSGKTPLVLWIAEFLKAHDWSPAIVSRGYGGAGGAPRAATLASEPDEVGDEPVLLARRSGCPVWVGAERSKVIEALRAQHPETDVVVLDDGLQHYRLRRDLEIAVVDSRGFGNGWLLPAGPLREPPRRLRTVHAVVSHKAPDLGTGNANTFEMRLEGEVAHRMSGTRAKGSRSRPGAAGRSMRSRASATRAASSSTWASSARRWCRIRSRTITPLPPASSSSATSCPC